MSDFTKTSFDCAINVPLLLFRSRKMGRCVCAGPLGYECCATLRLCAVHDLQSWRNPSQAERVHRRAPKIRNVVKTPRESQYNFSVYLGRNARSLEEFIGELC